MFPRYTPLRLISVTAKMSLEPKYPTKGRRPGQHDHGEGLSLVSTQWTTMDGSWSSRWYSRTCAEASALCSPKCPSVYAVYP